MNEVTATRVAVTGAAGFIGSHVVDWLVHGGAEVVACDDLSGGFIENVNPRASFRQIDVRDFRRVDRWFRYSKPEIVYHLAADATEGRSQFTPLSATSRNHMGYMNVLTAAIRNGARKIVFVSSMSVYGKQEPPFEESMPRIPVDIYGIAKAASEAATEVMSAVHGIEYTIIRPHNVYGPRQCLCDPYRNVVAIFLMRALINTPIDIYGDGEQMRAYTYITNCAPLIAEAGFRNDLSGEIVNVGANQPYTINQLVNQLELATGRSITRRYVDDRPQEVKAAWTKHDKMHRLFPDAHEISLPVGLHKTVQWVYDRYEAEDLPRMRYLSELEIDTDRTPQPWKRS